MREVEFLPDWYPKVRRRRRAVATQAWGTLAISVILGIWMLMAQRSVSAKQRELADISSSLTQSVVEVERLKQLVELHNQLKGQDKIFAMIGRPIEMTRILTTLEEAMPSDMGLLDLSVMTEEVKPDTLAAKAQQEKGTNRRVNMRMQGVAPTDSDLSSFMAKLTAKPFFSNIQLTYIKPRTEDGHVMREFEVTFALDLGGLGGN
jgi:Tfp pilus assembly protein PilN